MPGLLPTKFWLLVSGFSLLYTVGWAQLTELGTHYAAYSTNLVGNKLYFPNLQDNEIWVTDGTTAGTVKIANGSWSAFSAPTWAPGRAFVEINPDGSGNRCFEIIGTDLVERKLLDPNWRHYLIHGYYYKALGNSVFRYHTDFSDSDTLNMGIAGISAFGDSLILLGASGKGLFVTNKELSHVRKISDTTFSGTIMVTGAQSAMIPKLNTAGQLELWKTDGTSAGTTLLHTFDAPTSKYDKPMLKSVATYNGQRYFSVTNWQYNFYQLWRTTSDETIEMVFHLDQWQAEVGLWQTIGDRILFLRRENYSTAAIWSYSLTEGTWFKVFPLFPEGHAAYMPPTIRYGDTIYYIPRSSMYAKDRTLWKTDGTQEGTMRLTDTSSHFVAGSPVVFKDKLYYYGWSENHGTELYMHTGSGLGGVLVKDLNPNVDEAWDMVAIATTGQHLFFSHADANKVWVTAEPGQRSISYDIEGRVSFIRLGEKILLDVGMPGTAFGATLYAIDPAEIDLVTGIDDRVSTSAVFPNPSHGRFTYRHNFFGANQSSELHWSMYDILGRIVDEGHISDFRGDADLKTSASAGNYVLHFSTTLGIHHHRITIR